MQRRRAWLCRRCRWHSRRCGCGRSARASAEVRVCSVRAGRPVLCTIPSTSLSGNRRDPANARYMQHHQPASSVNIRMDCGGRTWAARTGRPPAWPCSRSRKPLHELREDRSRPEPTSVADSPSRIIRGPMAYAWKPLADVALIDQRPAGESSASEPDRLASSAAHAPPPSARYSSRPKTQSSTGPVQHRYPSTMRSRHSGLRSAPA